MFVAITFEFFQAYKLSLTFSVQVMKLIFDDDIQISLSHLKIISVPVNQSW